MKFILEIDVVNSAFFDKGGKGLEVARILREAADDIACGDTLGTLKDFNGNLVGRFQFKTQSPKSQKAYRNLAHEFKDIDPEVSAHFNDVARAIKLRDAKQ